MPAIHSERIAGHKRELAEKQLELAEGLSNFKRTAPIAHEQMQKTAPLIAALAAKVAPDSRAKLEAVAAKLEAAQSSQKKLEAFWGRVEVRHYDCLVDVETYALRCACASDPYPCPLAIAQANVSFSARALCHPERSKLQHGRRLLVSMLRCDNDSRHGRDDGQRGSTQQNVFDAHEMGWKMGVGKGTEYLASKSENRGKSAKTGIWPKKIPPAAGKACVASRQTIY